MAFVNWIQTPHGVTQWQALLHPLVSIKHTDTTHITLTSSSDDAQKWGLSLAIITHTGL